MLVTCVELSKPAQFIWDHQRLACGRPLVNHSPVRTITKAYTLNLNADPLEGVPGVACIITGDNCSWCKHHPNLDVW